MSVAAELCVACGHAGIEPRGFCPRCGSRKVELGTIDGSGAIWSLTTIHRPASRDGGEAEPHTVGLIALAAGPRLMTRLPDGLVIGAAVTVTRATLYDEPKIERG